MILTSLIIGGLIVGGGAAAIAFYDEIKNWIKHLKSVIGKYKQVFMQRFATNLVIMMKAYSQDELGNWNVTTEFKKIPANEVPPEILSKAEYDKSIDITKELELNA